MANSTNPCSSRSKQRQFFFSWWISKRSIVTRKFHHILLSDVSTQGLGPSLSNSTSGDEEEGGGGGGGRWSEKQCEYHINLKSKQFVWVCTPCAGKGNRQISKSFLTTQPTTAACIRNNGASHCIPCNK